MRGRVLSVGVAAVALTVSAVAPALAGSGKVRHFDTTVTIKTDAAAGHVSGKVKSDKDACVSLRYIILDIDGRNVFHTKANENGSYGIKTSDGSPLPSGDYQVRSPRHKVNDKVVCDAGKSRIVTIN